MSYQAICTTIGCGWKGTIFDRGNAIDEAYTEADAHSVAAVETYETKQRTSHTVIVDTIDNDSPEFEPQSPMKESVE